MNTKLEIDLNNDSGASLSMNPKKFVVWLFIVSIVMIFASLTSAYIVRQAEGNWKVFEIPVVFLYSTIVLILSSITVQWGYINAKKDEFAKVKLALFFSLGLGFLFLYMQLQGWRDLVSKEVYFSFTNPSESFLYVLTGLHAFHLVSGLIFIIIVLISALKLKVHAKSLSQYEMCATYWHFLDGLWLYLYVFLMFNR